MTILGIDLGTTNSAMAILKNGKPEIVENKNGGRTTPSVFQLNKNNEIVIGQNAKDTYPTLVQDTVLEIKRKMGTNETVVVKGSEYRPEEISAHILKYMKACAEEKLGTTITEAVITVPAYFSDSQRKATKKAGEIAGFKVERIINEPTAAAIAFGFDNMTTEQHLLVYDLGGGTFDVSVVEIFDGVVEVKASAGNNNLGGLDFDNAIIEWLIQTVKESDGVDLNSGSPEEINQRKARIKDEAERVKKLLSTEVSAQVNLPFIAMHEGAPYSVQLELTRHQFETLIRDIVESTMEQVDQAISDANLTLADINEVLLIGGSTRIPLVQELVEKKFHKKPRKNINPDEAVALGAAIQGGIKSGEIDAKQGLMVIDVCPYTLGTEIVKNIGGQLVPGFFDPIIPRNSTVPITEKKIYYTAYDDQEEVSVSVYQGESQYVEQNVLLSNDIVLRNIPKRPSGEEKIEVQFTYDINGILQVEATVLSTGEKQTQAIQSQVGVMSDQEVAAAKEKVNSQWEQSELYQEVKNVIYRAEKMMNEVDAADQKRMEALLDKLKEALSNNDTALVKKYEDELTDLLIELV